jgi:hypothetical protein
MVRHSIIKASAAISSSIGVVGAAVCHMVLNRDSPVRVNKECVEMQFGTTLQRRAAQNSTGRAVAIGRQCAYSTVLSQHSRNVFAVLNCRGLPPCGASKTVLYSIVLATQSSAALCGAVQRSTMHHSVRERV